MGCTAVRVIPSGWTEQSHSEVVSGIGRENISNLSRYEISFRRTSINPATPAAVVRSALAISSHQYGHHQLRPRHRLRHPVNMAKQVMHQLINKTKWFVCLD